MTKRRLTGPYVTMTPDIALRPVEAEEAQPLSEFVLSVFDEFVGHDYSEEGNRTFQKYVAPKALEERILSGGVFLAAYREGRIAGVIELRRPGHISLLFVDKRYQRRGISRELLNRAVSTLLEEDPSVSSITVNASPYSVPIYDRLGFAATEGPQEKDGIKFVPMVKRLR